MTTASREPATPTSRWHQLLREPLCHFAVIGLSLYLLSTGFSQAPDQTHIVIDQAEIARIQTSYQQQFGQPPTAAQLEQLLEHWVRAEIYWREGRALGLDEGDEIVRRRVAQKFEFLQQDLALPAAPDEGELRRYFEQHRQQYTTPARVSLQQVFIAQGDDREARAAALAVQLADTAASDGRGLGDTFPGQAEVVALSAEELRRLFGDSAIVGAAFTAPLNQWHGPVESGYGTHFIRVTARREAQLPALATVADQVRADWLRAQRQALNEASYRQLRAKYQISIEAEG